MSPETLMDILGTELRPCQEENPARCALADQAGQYVLDERGKIIVLNLFGWADREVLLPSTDWLRDLPHLQYLNLGQCGLSTLDLSQQTQLRVLFAQHNPELIALTLPAAFPDLLRADLSHCALSRLYWPESPVLEFLNVSRQKDKSLMDWSFAAASPRLYFCDLSHNGLTAFSLADGFTNLSILCLEDNELTEVAFEGALPGLESLRLSGNKLPTVKSEWLDRAPELQNLFLEMNNIEDRYQTFIEGKSPHEVVVSLRDVFRNEALGTAKDDECKIMLIGNGHAGKSTIVKRLRDGKFEKDYVSTHGAELFTYPRNDWKLIFWDFGGQDVYHTTHRLFMQSNVVYLLVWNKGTDPSSSEFQELEEGGESRPYRNYSLTYWLHYADSLGEGSPIILVQTCKKADGAIFLPPGLNSSGVEPAFVHQIESSEPDFEESGYDDLLKSVTRAVKKLKAESGAMAATNILAMRLWMRERLAGGQKIMGLDDYLAEAKRLAISGAEDVLKSWLHKTGVLFYNPKQMGGRIILDQEWAIDAIYTLFDRDKPYFERLKKAGGVFKGMELEAIWKDWPEADPELFVEFMLSCDVCFELPTGESDLTYRSFMVPGLLPAKPDEAFDEAWVGRPHWELHFCYDVLHYGLVQSFLVKTQEMADRGKMTQVSTKLVSGFELGTVEAQRAKEYLDRMVVKVGPHDFHLLGQITQHLAELQLADPEVLVRDPRSEHLVSFKRIDAAMRSNDQTVETESGGRVSVDGFYDLWNHQAKGRLVADDQQIALLTDAEVMQRICAFADQAFGGEKYVDTPQTLNALTPRSQESPKLEIPTLPAGAKTLLFATANPAGTTLLKLEKEFVKIVTGLTGPASFKPIPLEQASESKLSIGIGSHKPHILHFSGHGEKAVPGFHEDGIILHNEADGSPKLASAEILEKVFKALREWPGIPLTYVILNACHSHVQAESISRAGFTVVSTSTSISDEAAIAFSEGFYQALGRGEALVDAVHQGRVSATFKNLGDTKILIYHNGEIVQS